MMVLVFATLSLALLSGWFRRDRLAVASLVACLGLSIGLFLWNVHNRDYGFRMPWIQVQANDAPLGKS